MSKKKDEPEDQWNIADMMAKFEALDKDERAGQEQAYTALFELFTQLTKHGFTKTEALYFMGVQMAVQTDLMEQQERWDINNNDDEDDTDGPQ